MLDLGPGSVVSMTTWKMVVEQGWFSFKAPPGREGVFLLLGDQPKDGSKNLDLVERMWELGWVKDPVEWGNLAEVRAKIAQVIAHDAPIENQVDAILTVVGMRPEQWVHPVTPHE